MGCNTSQELKTKDGAIAINGEEVSNTSPVENFEQQTQNGNVHSNEQQQKGGVIGGDHNSVGVDDDNVTANTQIKSGNSHKHHTKSSSIISNGDANKHSKDAKIVFDSSSASPQKPFSIYKENGIATLNGDGQLRQYGRADISELNDMELGEDEEKAATKIQAAFRGHQVRNTMKKTETKTTATTSTSAASVTNKNGAASAAAAEPTKAELEAEFDPNDKELCDAALKIQSTFRGHLARKLVNKDEPEDVDIQEITKKVAEELDIDLTDPELNKAATKIQASFRGHKTRKEVPTSAE